MWRQQFTQRALRRLLPNSSRGLASTTGVVPLVGVRRSLSDEVFFCQGSDVLTRNVSRWNAPLGHPFSTTVINEDNAEAQQQESVVSEISDETTSSSATGPEKKELLTVDDVTSPGQAQQVLCRQTKILPEDFQKLVAKARPGNPQDAVVILYCLKHMKIYKELILSANAADEAVVKMLECLLSGEDEEGNSNATPQAKVDAAVMILNSFDEDTGLFFALRNLAVNKVLTIFLEGVQGGAEPKPITPTGKKASKEAAVDPVEENHPWVLTLHQLIRKLNFRRSRPYREMKKRAARKYMKHIRQHSGPNQYTLHLAAQIAMEVASPDVVRRRIVNPCIRRKCRVSDATLQLVGLAGDEGTAAEESDVLSAEDNAEDDEEEEEAESEATEELFVASDEPTAAEEHAETVTTEDIVADTTATEETQAHDDGLPLEENVNKTAS